MNRRPLTTDINGIPVIDGDKDRPSDYLRDVGFLYGKISDSLKTLLVAPKILSGLQVSTLGNIMSLTAGEALIYTPSRMVKYHDYNGEYLGQEEIPPYTTFVKLPADIQVDLTQATMDGSTTNFLVAYLKEIPKAYRKKPTNPTADYPFLVEEVLTVEPRLFPQPTDCIICSFIHNGSSIALLTDRSPNLDLNPSIIGDAQLKDDVKVGSLASLRDRIKTGIDSIARNVVNAINFVDSLLQTHTERVDNPHAVGLSQLTDVNNMGRRINNLMDAGAGQDAVTLAQLTQVNDNLSNALTNEGNTRASADSNLQSQISQVITSSGANHLKIAGILIQWGVTSFIHDAGTGDQRNPTIAGVNLPIAYANAGYVVMVTAVGREQRLDNANVQNTLMEGRVKTTNNQFFFSISETGAHAQANDISWLTIGYSP